MSTENMNGTQNGHCDEKTSAAADVGIAPGLHGDYVDPHLKAQREYESEYAKLALQGGHKGLLSMESSNTKIATLDEFNRRQKSCENISAYNKIALQGGHKGLLSIDENSSPGKQKEKANQATRTCGDWFADNQGGVSENNNTPSPKKTTPKCVSPEPRATPVKDQRRGNGNCIIPGGEEEPPRLGKKRFSNVNQRQQAPFATGY